MEEQEKFQAAIEQLLDDRFKKLSKKDISIVLLRLIEEKCLIYPLEEVEALEKFSSELEIGESDHPFLGHLSSKLISYNKILKRIEDLVEEGRARSDLAFRLLGKKLDKTDCIATIRSNDGGFYIEHN